MPDYNPFFDLRGKKIKDCYQLLLLSSGSVVYNGLGMSMQHSASYADTASYTLQSQIISITSSISSSWASQSLSSSLSETSKTASVLNGFVLDSGNLATTQTASNIVVIQKVTGSFSSAFYNYTISSGSNLRTGQVFGGWINNTCTYTDISTADIGDTSQVTMSIFVSGGFVQLLINAQSTNNWYVKASATYL